MYRYHPSGYLISGVSNHAFMVVPCPAVRVTLDAFGPIEPSGEGKDSMLDMPGNLPRLVGAARGDPYDARSTSGVPRHLFDALARRYTLTARINTEPSSIQKYLLALATFHPTRDRWAQRYWKNLLAFKVQSSNCRVGLRRLNQSFDAVIQVHALFRVTGAPYVVYVDNTHRQSVLGWPMWSPFGRSDLERWYAEEWSTYVHAEHLFTMGEPAARSLVEDYGIPAQRVTNVGGGANQDVVQRLDGGSRQPVILFVGKDFERKGGDCLIEAFKLVRDRVPAARLQIVGASPTVHLPGVEVLGKMSRSRLANVYARAAVFCLPSRFDPYPLAVMEAMATGLPCVSTFVGAIPEVVVNGETGLLVQPGNVRALAEALTALLENQAFAQRLGAAGQQRVAQHLTWDRVVDRMAPVLDTLPQPKVAPASGSRIRGNMHVVGQSIG